LPTAGGRPQAAPRPRRATCGRACRVHPIGSAPSLERRRAFGLGHSRVVMSGAIGTTQPCLLVDRWLHKEKLPAICLVNIRSRGARHMGMPISYKAGVFRNTPCYCLIVLACAGYAQAQTVITNIQDLENISSNLSGSYILENSINASNFNFTPIGSSSSPFTGTFNGNGFAIQNLSIYSSLDSVGLFASNLGTIQNLQLVNPHITASAPVPTLGGIAAINIGTIAQSHVDGGTLIANGVPTSAAPEQIVGGLVGRNSGTISNSHASDAVQVNTSAAGGLAGINSGTITQSYATGSVSGGNNSVLGGLLGSSYTTGLTSVSQSYATGNVVGGSYSKSGGLIGGNISPVVRSFATGNVSGGLGSDVGGLIGFHCGNVSVS